MVVMVFRTRIRADADELEMEVSCCSRRFCFSR